MPAALTNKMKLSQQPYYLEVDADDHAFSFSL